MVCAHGLDWRRSRSTSHRSIDRSDTSQEETLAENRRDAEGQSHKRERQPRSAIESIHGFHRWSLSSRNQAAGGVSLQASLIVRS
jgi:hypothetical protein